MYSLRVNAKTKQLVETVADMVGLSVYHADLSEWLTAEMDPIDGHSINIFRSCLVAACLDVKTRSAAQHQKIVQLDKELKEYENSFVTERRLYAEVM